MWTRTWHRLLVIAMFIFIIINIVSLVYNHADPINVVITIIAIYAVARGLNNLYTKGW